MGKKLAIHHLEAARQALLALKAAHPEHVREIDGVLADLVPVEAELRRQGLPKQRRKGEKIRYLIETVGTQPMLTEIRKGGSSTPFRATKRLYETIVGILAESKQPLFFDEVSDLVRKRLSPTPGEFQIRMVLRFLLRQSPPLLQRTRNRYLRAESLPGQKFRHASASAWEAATGKPKQ